MQAGRQAEIPVPALHDLPQRVKHITKGAFVAQHLDDTHMHPRCSSTRRGTSGPTLGGLGFPGSLSTLKPSSLEIAPARSGPLPSSTPAMPTEVQQGRS